MGLQRTPPQRVGQPPLTTPAQSESTPLPPQSLHDASQIGRPSDSLGMGDQTLAAALGTGSPSRGFLPKNPRVLRSPVGESQSPLPPTTSHDTSTTPEPLVGGIMEVEDQAMEVDQEEIEDNLQPPTLTPALTTTPSLPLLAAQASGDVETSSSGLHRNPPLLNEAGPSTTPVKSPPRTPASRTLKSSTRRKSLRTPAQVLSEPVRPIPEEPMDETEKYGKRYGMMMYALELAIKNGTQKWSVRDLQQCFPLLAKRMSSSLENVYLGSSRNMREQIENAAKSLLEDYRAAPALQLLDEVVDDAKMHKASGGGSRSDAWRPDISPAALTAATNLPIYDEAYERLRSELLELHADSSQRYRSIQQKRHQLSQVESSLSLGLSELDSALEIFDKSPETRESMASWMELVLGRLD
ncbi:hypothetical protein TREMEDRAFT_65976 [Tremella mesenterica DSM 1558]|uniref:uncharacterized protein n=1 Tax=Tremella mesenterica (strain ATCC 24925 / CBS 8224 / DSM 1558 / NBRC 9311 / NRRL Y-6157 / RJB 2259-6 / UBC 559-6) TaxID=578456 RepID=UPI00032C55F3|nr:uncharacterized protein TREMEDRAFT_65976 [Tremella mesenterica DSM 1558]EIW65891.1 hypothetical protein TREMEDRAFT_65976 [Tremella mesenterica DSM 1558]